jgi:anti-sigma B factor antagonist
MGTAREDLLTVDRTPSRDPSVSVFVVRGELDLCSRPILDEALTGCGGTVVLDLRALTFVDSTGVHAFIHLRRHLGERGGDLRLVYGAGQQLTRVFGILGLDELFPPYDDVDAAAAG